MTAQNPIPATPATPAPTQSAHAPPHDPDLAVQARPGHGVPSQDPAPEAQYTLTPAEAEREAHSTLVGGGAMAGMAGGATLGAVVGGPVGMVVGGTVGAIAGALGGEAAGVMTSRPGSGDLGTDAAKLHIEDSGGSGRPVVLIHGWPLSAQAWKDQVPALKAAGYRVVAYDRRGFGRSGKPESGYDYDNFADDLQRVLDACGLRQDVTLVGFSMGGGEVARYVSRHGEAALRSVVFAAAVPPFMMKSADNPEGPFTPEAAQEMKDGLAKDRAAFFDAFTRNFFSAHNVLKVSEVQRAEALTLCHQSAQTAALACIDAFGSTDFRQDIARITVPTLVIHGDADAIVPIEGSGLRTHRAIAGSELVTVAGAPHGLNVSHARAFNDALVDFLRRH